MAPLVLHGGRDLLQLLVLFLRPHPLLYTGVQDALPPHLAL